MSETEIIKQSLKDFTEKLGGIDATFLVQLSTARVQFSYPDEASRKSIATVIAGTISKFESLMQDSESAVEEMELVTKKQQILSLRVSEDFIICIVCPLDAPVGILKDKFERIYKSKITSALS